MSHPENLESTTKESAVRTVVRAVFDLTFEVNDFRALALTEIRERKSDPLPTDPERRAEILKALEDLSVSDIEFHVGNRDDIPSHLLEFTQSLSALRIRRLLFESLFLMGHTLVEGYNQTIFPLVLFHFATGRSKGIQELFPIETFEDFTERLGGQLTEHTASQYLRLFRTELLDDSIAAELQKAFGALESTRSRRNEIVHSNSFSTLVDINHADDIGAELEKFTTALDDYVRLSNRAVHSILKDRSVVRF